MNMNTKIVLAVAGIIVLGVAYWLVSPLWRNVRLDEALPGATPTVIPTPLVKDNMEMMDSATRDAFNKQMEMMRDRMLPMSESMPIPAPAQQTVVRATAQMVARAHEVEGRALLVQVGDQQILRFEDLKTINGPDLRIYLSADLSSEDFVDLGPIRATEGNVNYAIPAGTDTAKYRNALIWCRAFGVLFSYAQL